MAKDISHLQCHWQPSWHSQRDSLQEASIQSQHCCFETHPAGSVAILFRTCPLCSSVPSPCGRRGALVFLTPTAHLLRAECAGVPERGRVCSGWPREAKDTSREQFQPEGFAEEPGPPLRMVPYCTPPFSLPWSPTMPLSFLHHISDTLPRAWPLDSSSGLGIGSWFFCSP